MNQIKKDIVKNKKALVQVIDLKKDFAPGGQTISVLKGINLTINTGDFVIIFGPSGCGKSTLLHTILGLEAPTSGQVLMESEDYYQKTIDDRSIHRKTKVGTIFQQPIWIKALNVIDNVVFPLRLLGHEGADMFTKANQSLESVGMVQWGNQLPAELSAGQQQKVSLARALITDPIFLIADEPTGNLDTTSGKELMDHLQALNNEGRTIIVVTHDLEYLKYASKLVHMIDGLIVEQQDTVGHKITPIGGKKYHDEKAEINIHDPEFLKKLSHKQA